MGVLFPGPGVRITHDVVETLVPPRSYPIWELSHPHVIQESIVDVAIASPAVRVCSGTVTGLALLAALAGAELLDSPHTTIVATTVALTAAITTVGWRLWRRPRALLAYHRGIRVCLFVSRDRLLFGQVKRALLRAIEDLR
jgi:hypothetical protein